uniref:Uncharacterized protein n=1 Tax=Arundo donax TaxID=35708 RepID=A0A0A9EEJ2_ARUDO
MASSSWPARQVGWSGWSPSSGSASPLPSSASSSLSPLLSACCAPFLLWSPLTSGARPWGCWPRRAPLLYLSLRYSCPCCLGLFLSGTGLRSR